MSKATEAAQEAAGNNASATGPPSYDTHGCDEPYTANATAQQQLDAALDSNTSDTLAPTSRTKVQPPEPLRERLSLTMDDDLIYPTLPPSTAMYHIPRKLTWTGERVILEKSVPERPRKNGTMMPTADQDLYELASTSTGTIEIISKRRSCYGKCTGIMKKPSIFHSNHWEVRFQNDLVMKVKKGVWTDKNDTLLATEDKSEKPDKEQNYKLQRIIVIEAGLDHQMVNLLVACWMGKIWREVLHRMSKDVPTKSAKDTLLKGLRKDYSTFALGSRRTGGPLQR